MSHVICTNFVDLDQFFVYRLIVVCIFRVDSVLTYIFNSLNVVCQFILDLSSLACLSIMLFLLFLSFLIRCFYFFILNDSRLLFFCFFLFCLKLLGSLFWCLYLLFVLFLIAYLYLFKLVILYWMVLDRFSVICCAW